MNLAELQQHIEEGKPFIVYGDAMRYDPTRHSGDDPHQVYRRLLGRAELAVNIESEDEFRAGRKLPRQIAVEPEALALAVSAMQQALVYIETMAATTDDRLAAISAASLKAALVSCVE